MNRLWALRLAALVALAWLAAGLFAWLGLNPAADLVGLRRAAAPQAFEGRFEAPDVSEARALLEKTFVWGVARDGNPLPPPKSREEAARKIEWRLLAAVERGGEKLIVVQVGKDKPISIKEGEALPDGGRVVKVGRASVVVSDAEGAEREITTYIE